MAINSIRTEIDSPESRNACSSWASMQDCGDPKNGVIAVINLVCQFCCAPCVCTCVLRVHVRVLQCQVLILIFAWNCVTVAISPQSLVWQIQSVAPL